MRFLQRRLLQAIFLLVGVSVLCFLFSELTPGSYFDEMKLNPQISAETVAALKAQYGLDRPVPVRYVLWLKSVAKGEWGYSLAYNSPVRGLLRVRIRNTLILTTTAVLLLWLTALPLGIWVAIRPGRWSERLFMAGTSLLLAVPELVLALVLLYWVVRTHALPVGGMTSLGSEQSGFWSRVSDLAKHLVIPVVIIVLAGLPFLVRHIRSSMQGVLAAPFMQAAYGHGVGRIRLLFRYALPPASNPLISLFGLSVGSLLSVSLLVETIIGWPGLGPFLVEAVMSRDLHVVVAIVMASTLFVVFGNLVADVVLMMVDPRVRAE